MNNKRNVNYNIHLRNGFKKLSDEHVAINNNLNNQFKSVNEKLIAVDNSLNSNPFLLMFNSKGKKRVLYIIKFLSSALFVSIFFILFYMFFYNQLSFGDKILEILGNGFFWIIAVIIYFFVSQVFDDLFNRGVKKKNAKFKK